MEWALNKEATTILNDSIIIDDSDNILYLEAIYIILDCYHIFDE